MPNSACSRLHCLHHFRTSGGSTLERPSTQSVCQTDAVRLPPRKLSLISSFGEVGLAVVGGRLAFSLFHRGNVLLGIFMVGLSAAAVVLAVRYLREYQNLRATESES